MPLSGTTEIIGNIVISLNTIFQPPWSPADSIA